MVDKLTPQEFEILSESPADTTVGVDEENAGEDAPEGVVEQQED